MKNIVNCIIGLMLAISLSSCINSEIVRDSEEEIFKPHYIRLAMVYEGTANGYVLKKEILDKYDSTFVGRSMVKGHEKSDPDQVVGRILAADLRYDEELKLHYIEGIVKILSREAVEKIKQGLYYHVSISWMNVNYVCTAHNDPLYGKGCRLHKRGLKYRDRNSGKLVMARYDVRKFEGIEVSFVGAAASRHARILEISQKELKLSKR